MSETLYWSAFVRRHDLVMSGSEQDHEGQRLLERAGYPGITHHPTREAAQAAVIPVLDKVAALNPAVGWLGVWCYPHRGMVTGDVEEGRCYSVRRGPAEGDE